MARGIGEDPKRSPAAHMAQVDFPATREELVETAEDNESPPEVINFFKSLPRERYASQEELLRDFAEAERRMASGNAADPRARRDDIGRVAAEDAPDPRHP
ncbi:MAG: DUF2795 domain-containing protein [Myxococcales bacterium]|nr:DUF2795 domain-containing protein [Myxococcales bacterium]